MHDFCGWSKVIQVLFNYYLTSLVKQQEGQLACKNLLQLSKVQTCPCSPVVKSLGRHVQ